MTPQEYNRRLRVVDGWWTDEYLTKREQDYIELYLVGAVDEPPARWREREEEVSWVRPT